MESFGTRLAKIRKEHNFTQNDIAEKLNISPQAVSKWENDLTTPDIDLLVELSDIFDVTVDELLGKTNKTVKMVENVSKNIDSLTFKIIVDSSDGDKVRVNLPMAIIKVLASTDVGENIISGNKSLEGIDFLKLIALVEQGVLGEIVTVDSADGDHVRIVVE